MRLTRDEHQALSFIAALLFLSAAVRVVGLPEPVEVPTDGDFDLATHIAAVEAAVAEAEEMERPLVEGETLDPNTATAVQLARLPRVGPATAERIVADREANGRFRRLADLARVAGIGPSTLAEVAPFVTLPDGGGPGTASGTGGGVVDVNRADAVELATLPGIGPVLAARIVAFRDSSGPFATVTDLTRVKGIGTATVEGLAGRIVVGAGR